MSNAIPTQNLSSGLRAPALLTFILEKIVASKHDPVSARTGLIFVTFKSSSLSFVILQFSIKLIKGTKKLEGERLLAQRILYLSIAVTRIYNRRVLCCRDRYINNWYDLTNDVALYS
mmetsp:Transcript_15858/g.22678  ORF Transcript_15858/g.22678 Transcript_15858/m.22678 type:complete len:117 (-) Transcript_15858:1909-2259(-)